MQGFWKYEQRYLCQWILQRATTGLHVPGALMLVGFLFPTTVSQCVFQKTPAPDTKESGQGSRLKNVGFCNAWEAV